MAFPVDLLAHVSQTELERSAHSYMKQLLFSNPEAPDHLILSDSSQVSIDVSSVGFVPLYGSSDKHRILALFAPRDPLTAAALYLLDRWWTVDAILKTADSARDGPVEVETVGERIVLYILNRVVYRAKEMSSAELPFLCHGEKDHAKILWRNGEAVGFYSVRPTGSLCNALSSRRYQLPVMDSMFVRKSHRGKGFGLQMLEDFVLTFKEDCLGLRYPLTKAMYKVCEKYLCQYPGDTGLLWEVESTGRPNQRTSIASRIHTMDVSAAKRLSFTQEALLISDTTGTEAGSVECTVEIVEEVTVLSATAEGEVPLTVRARSGSRKMSEKTADEKVIRIEDIEAGTPREDQQKTHVSELHIESVLSLGQDAPEEAASVLGPQCVPTAAPAEGDEGRISASCDSQIAVENVASQVEESQQGDAAELEVNKQAEAEGSEERHESNLPTQETSEHQVAVQSRPKSRRLRKLEDGLEEKTSSQDGGLVLRGRTVQNTPPPRRKYTRHSQKVCEEVEVDEDAEEKDSTAELVEDISPIKEDVVVEDEGKTEKQQEAAEDGAAVNEVETPVMHHEQDVTNDETEERPAGDAGGEETAEEQVEEQDTSADETTAHVPEAEEAAEDVFPSTELNEKEKKVLEEQEAGAEQEDTGETQDKDSSASDIPKLPKATIILVDIKAPCHRLSVDAEDSPAAHPEQQQEEQSAAEKALDTNVETVKLEDESVRNTVDMSSKSTSTSNQQQEEDMAEGQTGTVAEDAEDTEEKLPAGDAEDAMEEEEAVESRALRRRTKISTATQRSRKQVNEPDAKEREEGEEPAVTRRLRSGSKSRRSRRQIQDEDKSLETGIEEEEAAKEAASEREEHLEPLIDVEDGEGRQVDVSGEEDEGRKPVMEGQEVEQAAAVVTRSLRSGAKTPKATPKTKKQQAAEASNGNECPAGTRRGPEEPEASEVEDEETALVSAEEPPTEAEKEEVTMVAGDEKASTAERDTLLPKAAAAARPTPPEDEQQGENRAAQVSDTRRVTVLLVDLQKTHQEQEDTTAAEAEEHVCEDQGTSVTTQEEEGADEEQQESSDTELAGSKGTSGIQEEGAAVQGRVLRRGRKSVPVQPRRTTRRHRKQLQEEEEDKGERHEEGDAMDTSKHVEAQLSPEKQHHEDSVLQQDGPEIAAETVEEVETAAETVEEVETAAETVEVEAEDTAAETLEKVEAAETVKTNGTAAETAAETVAETVETETATETAETVETKTAVETAAETVETPAETAAETVKTAETVETPAETVAETAAETVETALETVETPAETVETPAETVQTAETVETPAETVETAAETVQTAETTAETVKTVEIAAETAAETVETAAETVETAAETAETVAETVKTVETVAETAAETAAETTETAAETAETTVETAETVAETVAETDEAETPVTEDGDQSEEGTPSAAKDEEDEETAVTERLLRSGGKTRKRQADDQEEGKRKKFAAATLRRSKRGRSEEEEEEGSPPVDIPEETKAKLKKEEEEEEDSHDAAAQEEEEEETAAATRVLRSAKTKLDGKQEQNRVMRKGRKSAAATLRHTEEEEDAEDTAEDTESPEGGRGEEEEEGSILETDVEEKAEAETREEDEDQTKDGSGGQEEDTSVEAETEAPTLRSQSKRKNERQELTADSPRRSIRKRPRVDYKEHDEEGEQGEADDEEASQKAERSSGPDEGDEAEEGEEEEEPAMTGARVLRGRSLPSVMIVTPSKPKSAKVLNEEKSLRSAQKRKRPEVSASRRSQRLSRF